MHTICQEAFAYEQSRTQQNVFKLFWLASAVTNELQKNSHQKNANHINAMHGAGWRQRVQEYGSKMGSHPNWRERAAEVGIATIETKDNKPIQAGGVEAVMNGEDTGIIMHAEPSSADTPQVLDVAFHKK